MTENRREGWREREREIGMERERNGKREREREVEGVRDGRETPI